MSNDLVSVIIATYNMGQFLSDAIDSVLAQTYPNVELIVIDDGSTDKTREIMNGYNHHKNLQYIRQENAGQTRAKNAGIDKAQGKYIGFCDADDLWRKDKLENQLPCFEINNKIGLVHTDIELINTKGEIIDPCPKRKRYGGTVTENLFINNFISFGTVLIKSECLKNIGKFDENIPMGIDWDLWLRLSTAYEFYYLPEVTFSYRVWEGQMSKNLKGRTENTEKIMRKFINNYPGHLSGKTIRTAWADTYVKRGYYLEQLDEKKTESFKWYIKAIKEDMYCISAWGRIFRLMIRLVIVYKRNS